jgi:hypothetical protein
MATTDRTDDAFQPVRWALNNMPYGGGLPVDRCVDAASTAAVLEQLSERLVAHAARDRDDQAELDRYRQWIRTLRDIASAITPDQEV